MAQSHNQDPFEVVLTKIQLIVKQRRLRTRDFFADFDGPAFGFGNIPSEIFQRGLQKMISSLSHTELALVTEAYTSDVGSTRTSYVDYRSFCKDAERRPADLETRPTRIVDSEDDVTSSLLQQTAQFSQSLKPNSIHMAAQAKDCIEYIQQSNATRQDFEWFARDFDPHSRGHITPTQFEQVLSCGGVKLSPLQVRTLINYFSTESFGINYRAFFRALGYAGLQTDRTQPAALARTWPSRTTTVPFSDHPPDAILQDLQIKVIKSGRRLHDFCKDYDRNNCGRITESQFRRALNVATLAVADEDVAVLAEEYRHHDGLINYVALSNAVEAAVVPSKLEQDPLASTLPLQPIQDKMRHTLTLQETAPDAGYVVDVMEHVSDFYRQRRPELMTRFQDYDRCKTGCVTKSQFERVLHGGGFVLSNAEVQALSSRFQQRTDVNYRSFLQEVITISNDIQLQLSQPF
eukprot:m.9499 g.9499  ORF g.9499 m.9499 type:complete len:462 (-) comp7779_c0_seq1:236-1621(-)